MTYEEFLFLCKKVELASEELETMTIGMCLDYFREFVAQNNKDKKKPERTATQADFDAF